MTLSVKEMEIRTEKLIEGLEPTQSCPFLEGLMDLCFNVHVHMHMKLFEIISLEIKSQVLQPFWAAINLRETTTPEGRTKQSNSCSHYLFSHPYCLPGLQKTECSHSVVF